MYPQNHHRKLDRKRMILISVNGNPPTGRELEREEAKSTQPTVPLYLRHFYLPRYSADK